MNIIEISNDECLDRLSKPHNPPEEGAGEESFEAEYYALYDVVEPIMALCGLNDAYGQGDYYLEPCITRSRGLGLEVSNPAIITKSLLQQLQAVVAAHAPDWEIYLGSDNFDFGVFIGAPTVRVQRNSMELLKQLFD